MRLFGLGEPKQSLDSRLAEVWAKPEQHNNVDSMEQILVKVQDTLLQLSVGSNDQPLLLALAWASNTGAGEILLVTQQHVYEISRRGKVRKDLPLAEIARTELFRGRNGMPVKILTRTAVRDFMPDTVEQWPHVVMAVYPTPGVAQRICGVIDLHSPLINAGE